MVKLTIFNALYQEGDVNLVVDTGVEQVMVPEYLIGKVANFIVGPVPSPQLEADEKGISAPLRFGGNKFVCYFPWAAIRAMISKKAMVNFPPEEKEEADGKGRKGAPPLKLIK